MSCVRLQQKMRVINSQTLCDAVLVHRQTANLKGNIGYSLDNDLLQSDHLEEEHSNAEQFSGQKMQVRAFDSPIRDPSRSKSGIIKVLIAEDEIPILEICSRILSRSGFYVSKTFDNGKDLVEFVSNNNNGGPLSMPDVIVTDFRMPIMDGIEAAKIIRTIKPEIKMILASAYDVPRDAIELFDAVLRKPFGKKQLIESVSRSVGLDSD